MPQSDHPTTPAPGIAEARKPKPTPQEKAANVYSVTIDTGKGRILGVERVENGGSRRPLTTDEKKALSEAAAAMPLRRVVERAFEAGIEFVLGEDPSGKTEESKQDGELSSMLLQTLIEGSKARELVKGEALDRTVVDTLIGHVAKSVTPAAL